MRYKTRQLLVGILLAGKLLAACAAEQRVHPKLASRPAIVTTIASTVLPLLQKIEDRLQKILDDEKKIDDILEAFTIDGDHELRLGQMGFDTKSIGILLGQYFANIEQISQEIALLRQHQKYAAQAEILLRNVDAKKRIENCSTELYQLSLHEKYYRDHRSLEWLFRYLNEVMITALKESSNIKSLFQLKELFRRKSQQLVMETGFSSFSTFFR
ncbi:hypothetical protein HYT52_04940 [Candidatus Woesearchaeota archaeon]|nr:hypothetical protein [Candidatus Woesearchaeota archaeon]